MRHSDLDYDGFLLNYYEKMKIALYTGFTLFLYTNWRRGFSKLNRMGVEIVAVPMSSFGWALLFENNKNVARLKNNYKESLYFYFNLMKYRWDISGKRKKFNYYSFD